MRNILNSQASNCCSENIVIVFPSIHYQLLEFLHYFLRDGTLHGSKELIKEGCKILIKDLGFPDELTEFKLCLDCPMADCGENVYCSEFLEHYLNDILEEAETKKEDFQGGKITCRFCKETIDFIGVDEIPDPEATKKKILLHYIGHDEVVRSYLEDEFHYKEERHLTDLDKYPFNSNESQINIIQNVGSMATSAYETNQIAVDDNLFTSDEENLNQNSNDIIGVQEDQPGTSDGIKLKIKIPNPGILQKRKTKDNLEDNETSKTKKSKAIDKLKDNKTPNPPKPKEKNKLEKTKLPRKKKPRYKCPVCFMTVPSKKKHLYSHLILENTQHQDKIVKENEVNRCGLCSFSHKITDQVKNHVFDNHHPVLVDMLKDLEIKRAKVNHKNNVHVKLYYENMGLNDAFKVINETFKVIPDY